MPPIRAVDPALSAHSGAIQRALRAIEESEPRISVERFVELCCAAAASSSTADADGQGLAMRDVQAAMGSPAAGKKMMPAQVSAASTPLSVMRQMHAKQLHRKKAIDA